MKTYTCPEGHDLDGTLEKVFGVAQIDTDTIRRRRGKLTFEYGGYTEIDWNSQVSVISDRGERIFTCVEGCEFPESAVLHSPR